MKIRNLTDNEADELFSFIKDKQFVNHTADAVYQQTGPLREGLTYWIQKHEVNGECARINVIDKNNSWFESFADRLKKELQYSSIGRVYVHKLLPNTKIFKHADRYPYHFLIDRYQIFLKIPENCEIECAQSNEITSNCIFKLNHLESHSYNNTSLENFYIFILDFYHE